MVRHRRPANALVFLAFLVSCLPAWMPAQAAEAASAGTAGESTASVWDYGAYDDQYQDKPAPVTEATADSRAAADMQGAAVRVVEGRESVALEGENAWAEWQLTVPEDGRYYLRLEYYPLPGKAKDLLFELSIDGEVPFEEAARLSLPRIWVDEADEQGNTIRKDANDNELRPRQVEAPRWVSRDLHNSDGYYSGPYAFYLTAGEHTLRLTMGRESMAVAGLTAYNPEELAAYPAVYEGMGYSPAPEYQEIIQAENTKEKSSSMLYPTSDRTTPATQPSHPSHVRLNTIGAANWGEAGQWISWEVEVPYDGLYQLSFKVRQNAAEGLNSYRTLTIDGEVPFEQARDIAFGYNLSWYIQTLGSEEEPALVYLSAGEPHTITLECSSGPMADVLKGVNDTVLALNTAYREIIMVTGTSPDPYRQYYLEEEIPGLMDSLRSIRAQLSELSARIKAITGSGGSQASVIDQVIFMLDGLLEKPRDIPGRLDNFKQNIESLGSLTVTLASQPLELDYMVVSSGKELPNATAGLLDSIRFHGEAFINSFFEDYNSIGNTYTGEAVDVWISGGRDQAQVVKSLIDDLFTPQHGIPINLSLVTVNTGSSQSPLVQATLAGKGPDVAMLTQKDIPINLAMRGALEDLSQYEGFGDIEKRYFPSALIPYRYQGGVYAIPETQVFDMMFYRTDIFAELGLTPPDTWEEFYQVLAVLQKNNLEVGILETLSSTGTTTQNVGISAGIGFFDKLLYQNGGSYYTEDHSRTRFDTQVAYDAFRTWTELYTIYGLSRQFDFYSRFRTGEMPLGIQPYTMYNQLYHAAPEIRGLWDFVPIPGTRREDGTVDRTETADGTASILMKDCRDKEAAFCFLSWWSESEVQARYGNELEAIMGPAARYNTANVEAFEQLPWSDSEAAVLMEQWEYVTDTPQIPGNYFITRSLTSAFRAVVDDEYNPVFSLNSYNKDMNAEIARKRREFRLD